MPFQVPQEYMMNWPLTCVNRSDLPGCHSDLNVNIDLHHTSVDSVLQFDLFYSDILSFLVYYLDKYHNRKILITAVIYKGQLLLS